ncbi:hypothetical protein BGZ60DRAFT_433653 [Tricladium varicosporioides]|nr:hypothetical protein BGZ60DRAFT_433653 [Hymenoscyphus varicosporioides]
MGQPEDLPAHLHYSQSLLPPKKHHTPLQKWFISLSILSVILTIIATALIVIISNGQTVKEWKVRPSVILAILSSFMGVVLSYLLSNGIAITWWHAAGKGTTVEHLHQMTNKAILFQPYQWSIKLFADRSFTSVVLGTLVISITTFAVGPMVQQSTRTQSSILTTEGLQLKVNMLQKIPDGLAGSVLSQQSGISATFDLTAAAVRWYRNDTINNTGSDSSYSCNGTCHGIVQTPGISVECSTSTQKIDLYSAAAANQSLFLLAFNLAQDTDGHPLINFTSQYSSSVDSSCESTIVTDTCWVYAATTKQPITIEGSSIKLSPLNISDLNSTERTYSQGDMPLARDGTSTGPLGGLMYLVNTYFKSYSSIAYINGVKSMETRGTATETFYIYSNLVNGTQGCHWTWRSPTVAVLNAMSETLFRLAMNSNSVAGTKVQGNTTRVPQVFDVRKLNTELVFKSDYRWLVAALVVEGLALLVVLGLVWGRWRLKREVTLSPVETLQAFVGLGIGEREGERDISADDMVKSFGAERVRYIPEMH